MPGKRLAGQDAASGGRPAAYVDHADGTVTDTAAGLTRAKAPIEDVAFAHAAATATASRLGGHDDWRLPTARESQSIIDTIRVPAMDAVFTLSDPAACLWTSTTHLESPPPASGKAPFRARRELAVHFIVGQALGKVESPPGSGRRAWLDVDGAGARRSDPKTASPGAWPGGFGPQGDDIRGADLAKCVRMPRADPAPPRPAGATS